MDTIDIEDVFCNLTYISMALKDDKNNPNFEENRLFALDKLKEIKEYINMEQVKKFGKIN